MRKGDVFRSVCLDSENPNPRWRLLDGRRCYLLVIDEIGQ